ncbi:MAG: EF-hand domain-containing protein [Thalassotalea sp.]|nr:EF-hand domain-containing protein [Thalassotalea sp.]
MNISGNSAMMPPPMTAQSVSSNQMQERFKLADSDESGTLTLEEMQASAPEGLDAAKVGQLFSKMDANGDGEVTEQEQKELHEKMAERMEKLQSSAQGSGQLAMGYASQGNTTNAVDSLLDRLGNSEDLDEAQQTKVQEAIDMLSSNCSPESMKNAMSVLQDVIPSVDVHA